MYNKTSCFKCFKIITDYTEVKQTKLQPLKRQLKQKVFTKVINMPILKAWVQRPSGLIKSGSMCKRFKRRLP